MNLNIMHFSVGTTRSGKMILYVPKQEDIDEILNFYKAEGFSSDDRLDAFALFEYLALRAKRRNDSDFIFKEHADSVIESMSADSFNEAKRRANITPAFALRDLGQSRASKEFSDM